MKSRRKGATLFEILVVVAILALISAMTYPSLQAMYGGYKLNAAVDSVRSAWADARARAINENRAYRFSVEPEGSSYRVAPDNPDYWNGTGPPSEDPNGIGLILAQSLPAGVRFTINGEGSDVLPDELPSDVLAEKPVTTNNWSTAVIFQPDGTAREDVKVTFRVRGCKPTSIQLRGLTGDVTVHQEQ